MNPEDVRFIVITPTCGRGSLKPAVLSALCQFKPGDMLFVVSDGPVEGVKETCEKLGVCFVEGPQSGNWGNSQRNYILTRVERGEIPGTHLLFLDDDDRLIPKVLDKVRQRVAEEPDRMFLFRFLTPYRLAVWRRPRLEEGNVGTGSIVCPVEGPLGRYGTRYEGDFDFIYRTCEMRRSAPVFSPLYLQVARPQPGDCEHLAELNERIVP